MSKVKQKSLRVRLRLPDKLRAPRLRVALSRETCETPLITAKRPYFVLDLALFRKNPFSEN
jgi:hypothetical protein